MSLIAISLGPFFIAALAGSLLALFELFQAFQREIGTALRNRWAWLLLGLNALAAVSVYSLVRAIGPDQTNPLVTPLVVGLTFPAAIRSRFTFFRNPGQGKAVQPSEVSLPLDRMYTTLQAWCYTEANIVLADQRNTWATALANSDFDLLRFLPNVIRAGALADRRQEYEAKYQEIYAKYSGRPEQQRHMLALLYIDIMPRRAVRRKIREVERASLVSAPVV